MGLFARSNKIIRQFNGARIQNLCEGAKVGQFRAP
jgi:hypothetical protein